MGQKKNALRLWAVLLWLALWQLAAMALRCAYPHGNLLLASPVSVLERLWQLACTAAFWETVGRCPNLRRLSALHDFGGALRRPCRVETAVSGAAGPAGGSH